MYSAARVTQAPEGSGSRQGRKRCWTPVSALEFVGCDSCRMTLREYEALDEDVKVEFFDSEVECAWMLREPEHLSHAKPGARLAELARETAMTRGSPIVCCGEAQLRLLDRDSGQVRVMYPDQTVFLRPEGADSTNRLFVDVGEDAYPDVVLEVDNTRDTRRDKLVLYEEWGFPELWVEVPDSYAPSRPRGLRPELRIYVLEETGYLLSGVSRAFPGWSAPEIHRALNEPVISAATSAVLRRVGRALGTREGTGPDDAPLLGAHRAEARAEERAESAREILRRRGIAVLQTGWPPSLRAVRRRQKRHVDIAILSLVGALLIAQIFRVMRCNGVSRVRESLSTPWPAFRGSQPFVPAADIALAGGAECGTRSRGALRRIAPD